MCVFICEEERQVFGWLFALGGCRVQRGVGYSHHLPWLLLIELMKTT